MRKVFIIWNPAAGGKSAKILKRLVAVLKAEKIDHLVADTQETRNATTTVKNQLDTSFTDLIIIGGDGTINEAINGLDYDIPVGIIPAGTGDDFVKMVELGKSLDEQIRTAIHGTIRSIDLGICNDRKFVNGIGIGFDGQIVEDMISKRVPLLKGHAAYYYHVLRILGGYREKAFRYLLDGEKHSKELILLTIGNGSTFGGGFKLMPHANIDDGMLEVCEIGKLSGFRRFLNIHKLSNGSHGSMSMVNHYQAKQVVVDENPLLFAHIDGERLGNPPFDIRVLPKALMLRTTLATSEEKRIKLKNVLERTSFLLSKSEASDWSPLAPRKVAQNLRTQIANIDQGLNVDKNLIALEFAPTSTIQEISMSNNWSDEYLAIAHEIDMLLDGLSKSNDSNR